MRTRNAQRLASFTALLFAAASTTACDNPVRPDDHEADVHGVSIRIGDAEIARYFDGELTGELPPVSADAESALLTFVFLDHEGDAVDLAGEEEAWLRARPADAEVADFEVTDLGGRVIGVAEGETTIAFDLMHGEEPLGHADFSTVGVPVTVIAP